MESRVETRGGDVQPKRSTPLHAGARTATSSSAAARAAAKPPRSATSAAKMALASARDAVEQSAQPVAPFVGLSLDEPALQQTKTQAYPGNRTVSTSAAPALDHIVDSSSKAGSEVIQSPRRTLWQAPNQRSGLESAPKTTATENSGLAGVVLETMRSDSNGKREQLQLRCIRSLNSLVEQDIEHCAQICAEGGVALVVDAMRALENSLEVLTSASKLIGKLCDSFSTTNTSSSAATNSFNPAVVCLEHDAFGELKHAVSRHSDSFDLAEAVVFAVGSMILSTNSTLESTEVDRYDTQTLAATEPCGMILTKLMEQGVVELITKLMKRWRPSSDSSFESGEISVASFWAFQGNCMAILEHISLRAADGRIAWREAGAVSCLVQNIQSVCRGDYASPASSSGSKHKSTSSSVRPPLQEEVKAGLFVEQAIRSLCSLAQGDSALQQHIGDMGGVEAVVLSMRYFDAHVGILSESCVTLRYLMFTQGNRVRLAACRGVEAVKNALVRLQIEPLPLLNALLALSNSIFMSAANEAVAIECDTVETIAGVMRLYHSKAEFHELGCRVFRNLAFTLASHKRSSKPRSMLIDSVMSSLIAFPEARGVQLHGVAALVNLSDSYGKDLLENRLEEHLESLERRFAEDEDIMKQSAALLERLCEETLSRNSKSRGSFVKRVFSRGSSTAQTPSRAQSMAMARHSTGNSLSQSTTF